MNETDSATAPVNETPGVSKVEDKALVASEPAPRKCLNTGRMERMKFFKLKPAESKIREMAAFPVIIQPLNPDLHADDIRLVVSIKLEGRDVIIHERTADKNAYRFILPKGNASEAALAELSKQMNAIAAAVCMDFENHIATKRPLPDIDSTSVTKLLPTTQTGRVEAMRPANRENEPDEG